MRIADASHLYVSFRALDDYHVTNGRCRDDVPFVKLQYVKEHKHDLRGTRGSRRKSAALRAKTLILIPRWARDES